MSRSSVPEIPAEALKNHASAERVERVWRRLELDTSSSPRARRSIWWWAPAMASAIFAAGVLVGVRFAEPPIEVRAQAEPRARAAAAGTARIPELERVSETPPPAVSAERREPAPAAAKRAVAAEHFVSEPFDAPPNEAVPEVKPAGPAEWEELAESGDFRAAQASLDRSGGFDRVIGTASPNELMSLADVARMNGNREQAARALRRVLSAYVSSPEAPIAAWTLGNLLDQAGDKLGAAEAYATYRRLSPAGDFAEDAAARQVDVALSQGNLELATRALDEYAGNFPRGRRTAELRARLASLAAGRPSDAKAPGALEPGSERDDSTEPSDMDPVDPEAASQTSDDAP